MEHVIRRKTFVQRLRTAVLTLGLPIAVLALLPLAIVAFQTATPVISRAMGEDISPLQIAVITCSLAYAAYSYRNSEGLRSGVSALISSFMVVDLLPIFRAFAVIGDGLLTYLGSAALIILVATDFLELRVGHSTEIRRD